MAKKQYSAIAIIVLMLFLGVAAMILYMPSDSGKAMQMPPIEDKFRMYFLASALVNHQANQGIHQAELDIAKHGKLQKTPQQYFGCPAMLSNIKAMREAREVVMDDFSHLAEMNCFYAVSDADQKKFRLLEEQCSSKEFNTELPAELQKIYDYQKKSLNKGCMKHSGLQELLRTTKVLVTEKNGMTRIQIQK
ncbi:hypothetical protein KY338_04840 [Candidatus Woesearchaeota archaeon]|nr:hypothetical protein [Candidatus Woesearchaeota archaeon]MBW3006231.1 hypothetical protein [Candidatus Woesearchaeota archaeon]